MGPPLRHTARLDNQTGRRAVIARLARIPGRVMYEIDLRSQLAATHVANTYGHCPIVSPGGPVVSLTTHGDRVRSVYLVIESIGRGQTLPSRIILWVDDPASFASLPLELRRLQSRGLEVKLCRNYGPHTKYYPYVESLDKFELPLVTADDDLLYPRYWLKRLVEANRQFPEVINCHRAHSVVLNRDGIARYESWREVISTKACFRHVATGVAGVIYPIQFQRALKRGSTGFLECCPKADDIWLHALALRTGYKVRQISRKRFRLLYLPGTQNSGLLRENLIKSLNDRQIASTYGTCDIERMREADRMEEPGRPDRISA
jgi:hypothetical protein